MLNLQRNNNKFDLIKSQKAIEKSFILAAQQMGSMRGVLQGDMQSVVTASKLKNVA